MGSYNEKIIDAKWDPNIEPPSHETYLDVLPYTCKFENDFRRL